MPVPIKKGWEQFTDAVIAAINEKRNNVVYLLWGSYVQRKGSIIDGKRHHLLRTAHPSPLSAYRGFFGCGPFVKASEYLREIGQEPIEWAT